MTNIPDKQDAKLKAAKEREKLQEAVSLLDDKSATDAALESTMEPDPAPSRSNDVAQMEKASRKSAGDKANLNRP